jgi:hypothetical protein
MVPKGNNTINADPGMYKSRATIFCTLAVGPQNETSFMSQFWRLQILSNPTFVENLCSPAKNVTLNQTNSFYTIRTCLRYILILSFHLCLGPPKIVPWIQLHDQKFLLVSPAVDVCFRCTGHHDESNLKTATKYDRIKGSITTRWFKYDRDKL